MTRNAALAALLVGLALVAPQVALADTSITLQGSTALLPLVKDAAGVYQQAHPDVKIAVSGGGSGTGINLVAARAIDVGNSDILAPAHPELVDHKVCVIGFAVIANPGVGVKNLSKKQIQDVFGGKVTNWKEVGGADQKITVVNRPRSSGTRAVFTKTLMGSVVATETGLTEDATGTVVDVVSKTPGAVSYAALSGTRGKGLLELSVDGIAPSDENIYDGKYPMWSYEHMFTNGPPSADVSRFIAFVTSNSALVKKDGYLLIRNMKVTETDR